LSDWLRDWRCSFDHGRPNRLVDVFIVVARKVLGELRFDLHICELIACYPITLHMTFNLIAFEIIVDALGFERRGCNDRR
jgi:hypothetical protein